MQTCKFVVYDATQQYLADFRLPSFVPSKFFCAQFSSPTVWGRRRILLMFDTCWIRHEKHFFFFPPFVRPKERKEQGVGGIYIVVLLALTATLHLHLSCAAAPSEHSNMSARRSLNLADQVTMKADKPTRGPQCFDYRSEFFFIFLCCITCMELRSCVSLISPICFFASNVQSQHRHDVYICFPSQLQICTPAIR